MAGRFVQNIWKALAAAVIIPAALSATPTWAAYPDRAINAVVPFDVGGSSDILARVISSNFSKVLGQTVVVLNKAGAAGNVGMSFVAKAKPDGYTVLFTAAASTQNPAMYSTMPYDPEKDLVGIGQDGASVEMVVINPAKVKASNLAEFIDLLKKNPGKYNAAAGGLSTRLSVEFFRISADVKVEIVPYNSAGDAATSLLNGETDFMVVDGSPIQSGVAAGKLKVLAVGADKRLGIFPDVPTADEAGLKGWRSGGYHALYAPAGTPQDILTKLNATMNQITQQPDVQEQYRKLGWVTVQKSQPDFQAFYLSEIKKWKNVVNTAHIPKAD